MQGFLREVLAAEGYSVLTSSDGQDALNQALTRKPDLVLLDLRMPSLDGVTFCKAVRADQHAQNIPIIVVSPAATPGFHPCIFPYYPGTKKNTMQAMA